MTVTLPETMRDELHLKAKSAGFRDVDTYVAYLVVADDGDGVDEFADADFAIPDELIVRSREDLERKLEEGFNSGPFKTMTPDFWEKLEARVQANVKRRLN